MRWGNILLAFAIGLFTSVAFGQSLLERLVSPGELSRPHREVKACLSCHMPFRREAQNGKCLACHKDVAADLRAHTGLHGRWPRASTGQCRDCHSEHHGLSAAIVRFPRPFDHHFTDYALHGAHLRIPCAACHSPGRPWRVAQSTCIACHAKNDVHEGRFGQNCAACHNDIAWRQVHGFDHRLTGYPLVGAHASAPCASCHRNDKFAGTPTTCIACHRADDAHHGERGTNCAACHSPLGWRLAVFDHSKTGFPLIGMHQTVSCSGCHGTGMAVRRPDTACASCHRRDDVHQGHNGAQCQTCHSPAGWKIIAFDHDRLTRFALHGAHRGVACVACHRGPLDMVKPPLACVGCHGGAKDPHRGALGPSCGDCHNDLAWRTGVRFDHALTGFPLLGAHAGLTCRSCHADKTFRAAGRACIACHADTFHQGRFGRSPDCASCHSQRSWRDGHFDHATTGFPLDGAHAGLSCASCHRAAAPIAKLNPTCASCHRADDVHKGSFGPQCGTCHATRAWRPATVPRGPTVRRRGV